MKTSFKILSTFIFIIHFGFLNSQTVVDIVVGSPDHNTLETAVIAADLATTLSGPGPFTVFAPTDAAFAAIDPAVLAALLDDPSGDLTKILTHHVVSGVASSDNIYDGLTISNLFGQNLTFDINGAALSINGANISVANIRASNGMVHVIDAVMLPEIQQATVVDVVVNSPDHTTLETAVLAAGLQGALSGPGPFTLFAPTDAAFAALDPAVLNAALADPQGLLTQVLTYHAVNGVASAGALFNGQKMSTLLGPNIEFDLTSGAKVNNANIIVTDIRTGNGVVHVIDAVMIPDPLPVAVAPSIVDIVVNSPDHTTLETAVLAAGLQGALSGPGPFTLFAPTDAAFAALDPATLAAALDDPSGLLTEVLTYHAVRGVANANQLFDGQRMQTLQGTNIQFGINANGAFVNNAQIIVTDIKAENGVVHVIDAVLLP